MLTLSEIKTHLRIEQNEDAENEYLNDLADAVHDYVQNYLNRDVPWKDEDGQDVPIPAGVKHAALLIIGDLYEHREAKFVGTIVTDNRAADALLHFHRVGIGI